MDFSITNTPILAQTITAYQKPDKNEISFAIVGLNICLPNTSKKEMSQLVKDNFRSGKDRILKKGSEYYILMKDTSVEVAERAVNRLKAKLSFMSRNFWCSEGTKCIQAAAFILGTSKITKKIKYTYVDLTPASNFKLKRTPMTFGLKKYLSYSVTSKAYNHQTNSIINVVA